jgi:hypothetical protein
MLSDLRGAGEHPTRLRLRTRHALTPYARGLRPNMLTHRRLRAILARIMRNRLTRRRSSLFTQAEVARQLGCSVRTVQLLERSFLTERQRKYLALVGYQVGFYPIRKYRQEGGVDLGDPVG